MPIFRCVNLKSWIYVKSSILGLGSESQVTQTLWLFDPTQLQREHVQPASCGVPCTCGRRVFAHSRMWHCLQKDHCQVLKVGKRVQQRKYHHLRRNLVLVNLVLVDSIVVLVQHLTETATSETVQCVNFINAPRLPCLGHTLIVIPKFRSAPSRRNCC